MKNKILLLTIVVLFFTACTSNVEPIVFDMPASLEGSIEAESFISEYAMVGGSLISLKSELRSETSVIKKAKAAMNITKANSKIEEIKANRSQIETNLTEEQKKAFDKVIYRIEASIGQMRLDIDAIDESEMAANIALKDKQQSEIDKEMALREEAIAQMKADGTWEEPKASSNEFDMPMFMQILIGILIVVAIIYSIIKTVKSLSGKVKEFGHTLGGAKGKYAEAMSKMKEMEGDGKELSEEQKTAFEFLDKHLGK